MSVIRAHVMSDIHLEWHKDRGKSFINSLNPGDARMLILPGDITQAYQTDYLKQLCDMYEMVLYVIGNHELYATEVHKAMDRLKNLPISNLKVLDNEMIEIDGKRFLGSTLWFNKDIVVRSGARETWLNDFVSIEGFREWVYDHHEKSAKWLRENVKPGDIVITHHLPSMDCVAPRFKSNPYNCFFASNQNDTIIQNKPALWIFGHTHTSMDFIKGNTRMLCNPFGYAGEEENPDFKDDLIIDI